VVSACYTAIGDVFLHRSTITSRFVGLGALILALYQLAALWQCAYNNPSPFVARIIRTAVAVGVVVAPLLIYTVMEHGLSP
jgi:hypothetical protein